PIHQGKRETLDVVAALVTGAPPLLAPRGSLVLVIQRRLPAGPLLESSFPHVRIVADDGPFRLWEAAQAG
ncbi:MAG: methyltransferase, partial [Gemmatimonadetes bacterium]|nr:methyltransferase [Gemmatimonadota bacterium]